MGERSDDPVLGQRHAGAAAQDPAADHGGRPRRPRRDVVRDHQDDAAVAERHAVAGLQRVHGARRAATATTSAVLRVRRLRRR